MKAQVILFVNVAIIVLALSPLTVSATDHSAWDSVGECITCHPRTFATHQRKTPEIMTKRFPLDDKGRMLCVTCHSCITGQCVLRKQPVELCQVCHDCTTGMACMLGVAHMGDVRDPKAVAAKCLRCHTCTAPMAVKGFSNQKLASFMVSKGLLSRGEEARIVLFDGKLACTSCHNPYHPGDQRMAIPNVKSPICLNCHRR